MSNSTNMLSARLCGLVAGLAIVLLATVPSAAAMKPAPAAPAKAGWHPSLAPALMPPALGHDQRPVRLAAKTSSSSSGQSIVALVNDQPITAWQVEQRARLNALSSNVQGQAQSIFQRLIKQKSTENRLRAMLKETLEQNQGKSREQILAIFERRKQAFAVQLQKRALGEARSGAVGQLRKAALEELIDEQLKLQEAKRQNTLASKAEVDRVLEGIATRNKMTPAQFAQHIKRSGADISTMRDRLRTTLSWTAVIRRQFSSQIAITQRDLDRMVGDTADSGDKVELEVQRIVLALQARPDQKDMASRLQAAEQIRSRFRSCKTAQATVQGVAGARLENLGKRPADAVPEPTRSLLMSAKSGEMLPPQIGTAGVELWMLCGREVVKASEQKEAQARDELRQREFQLHAARHLKNLRQDALIDYRE